MMDLKWRYFLLGFVIGALASSGSFWKGSLTEDVAAISHTVNERDTGNAVVGKFVSFPNKSRAVIGTSVIDDLTMASELHSRVRVFCWVMTSPATLPTRAARVKETWGKNCNALLFMSSQENSTYPAINVRVPEGRSHLTGKTMHAFKYLYDNHLNDADWFLKSDDDTYVIVENLRLMLADKNPNDPIFFGHHFKTIVKPQGYMSGGAGYVLSREALRRYGSQGHHKPGICREDGGAEDVAMGQCMQNLGVRAGDSYDASHLSRFHCFTPAGHIHGPYPAWYRKFDAHGAKLGFGTLSNYSVSFHYISPRDMYNLDFFVNRFQPYGTLSSIKVHYHDYYFHRA